MLFLSKYLRKVSTYEHINDCFDRSGFVLNEKKIHSSARKTVFIGRTTSRVYIRMSFHSRAGNNPHRLSEILPPLGAPFGTHPLNLPNTWMVAKNFKGVFNWAPLMPRNASPSDNCTPDRCIFSSLAPQMMTCGCGVFVCLFVHIRETVSVSCQYTRVSRLNTYNFSFVS